MTWGIVALLLLALAATWIWIFRSRKSSGIHLLQQQLLSFNQSVTGALANVSNNTSAELARLNQRLDERLNETNRLFQGTHETVGARLDQNTQVFGQVQEKLGKLEEANQQIRAIGLEIARLQDVLRVPKLRGNLSELFLEELLSQILPTAHYQMQYCFRSGAKVDAIVRLPQGNVVPIDAKFPLENFQRFIAATASEDERKALRRGFVSDVKKHIEAISTKYILPDEGTLDFALMYIPAENVYYEIMLNDDRFGESQAIHSYALSKRVIPVSPSSLYAYLQLVVLGLRGLRIEQEAKGIFNFLSRLQGDLRKMHEEFQLVGKHLSNSLAAYERSEKKFDKVVERVRSIGEQAPIESAEKAQLPVENVI